MNNLELWRQVADSIHWYQAPDTVLDAGAGYGAG
jgi:hypothetical protein